MGVDLDRVNLLRGSIAVLRDSVSYHENGCPCFRCDNLRGMETNLEEMLRLKTRDERMAELASARARGTFRMQATKGPSPSRVKEKRAKMDSVKKDRKPRAVNYDRTSSKPHSFRYKRGSEFTPRAGEISLAKEADGSYVIGQIDGSAPETTTGTFQLVSVKKRDNGKTAIAFKHPELGTVYCYDARVARAGLKANSQG